MRVEALLLTFLLSAAPLSAALSEEAIRLRNRGLAELENEQPALAETSFRRLAELLPGDPLAHADLAVALLRQQKFEEAHAAVRKALERSPGDPRLLAIQAEIYQWGGDPETALTTYRRAADAAPDSPDLQYALYRQASVVSGEEAESAARVALERLGRLRPENLVVMLQLGQQAQRSGDRAGATAAFLRVRELVWQAPDAAAAMLDQVLAALEANDLEAARVPALRLENVLKVTAMFRESLRELAIAVQGVPIERFRDEPTPAEFGSPVEVRLRGQRLSELATAGRALALGDFDGDERTDLARLTKGAEGRRLEVRLAAADWAAGSELAASGLERLLAADLDNDGHLDLIGYGPKRIRLWRGAQGGQFSDGTAEAGLEGAGAAAAEAIDFDIEGDLDLALTGGASGAAELYLNAMSGPLQAVGGRTLPALTLSEPRDLIASDLDRDGDLDLLIAHAGGLALLDNLRQGKFALATEAAGLTGLGPIEAVTSADLDNDGLPDLAAAGRGLTLLHNRGGRFEPWELGEALKSAAEFRAVAAFDADNDGRLDLAVAGPEALAVLAQKPEGGFRFLSLEEAPRRASALAAADLDRDGDLDLVAAGSEGLHRLENLGGNRNRWLSVRLRGLLKGNSKNNLLGRGAVLEVRAGASYQFREATSEVTHFGLGKLRTADLLRVVWTNGVPQNRLEPAAEQRIVEEQVLKGSCPFLYAWDGERVRFVTDLLWGAPAGLPVAPGVWAVADHDELVRVDGAKPVDGVYDLRVTEELWEAAFVDLTRLWVVDHPASVEVASALRVLPGERTPEQVLGTRDLRPVEAAWDATGLDVTERVRFRDEVYADGWEPSRYQGRAQGAWSFAFDLGEAPARPVRLHLEGWIFPADASLNLAMAQRADLPFLPPRLEAETAAGWQVLVASIGHPAGKTKPMLVDTPPLPPEVRKLRIVSSLWLSWDRIAWSMAPADGEPLVRARLLPASADLHFRGFSAPRREAPNAPHIFDYARVSRESPWLPFPGRYTRYGDVRELLLQPDDRSVILGPGDELTLRFDASELPPPPAGWERTLFLESHGWDKDADRNTWEAKQVEPLPFRAMSGYPYGPGESFPDTPLHREYREQWLSRTVSGD